ncbi:hypothetical protein SKAU_G00163840 [Synaphobranchus kaupii]|uniref:Uncharacterized protein n=1 Tax=Synaphobranchus kaupii TaxID=118154 RepID=A0A9Q1FJH8_SYNKA|nr:hypothetical protein SKAU_G00163840 [Synaphobranchus kaupii]
MHHSLGSTRSTVSQRRQSADDTAKAVRSHLHSGLQKQLAEEGSRASKSRKRLSRMAPLRRDTRHQAAEIPDISWRRGAASSRFGI